MCVCVCVCVCIYVCVYYQNPTNMLYGCRVSLIRLLPVMSLIRAIEPL